MNLIQSNQVQARGAEQDQQERPRLLPDVVTVTLDTAVLIDGLGRQQLIQGPIAQTVLPELLHLLDGSRTLRDLEDAFPSLPADYVRTAILSLKEWGIIEPAADSSPSGVNPDTVSFLRRHIATSGFNLSVHAACARLRDTKVFIAADHTTQNIAESLQHSLQVTGAGSVFLRAKDHLGIDTFSEGTILIALSTQGEDLEWYGELDKRTGKGAFSWLRVAMSVNGTYADVGPLFRPGDSCYSCFHNTHVAGVRGKAAPPVSVYEEKIWASLTALEVIYLLTAPSLGLDGRKFRRFHLPEWNSRSLDYPRLPGCRSCQREPLVAAREMGGPIKLGPQTDTALVFEEYVGLESRTALSPSARSSFAQMNQILEEEAGRVANCERIPLYRGNLRLQVNALEAMRANQKFGPTELTIDKLAVILALTGGIREIADKNVRRWPATAGNLGSVDLFIVNRTIPGLNVGFYYYEARDHCLASWKKRVGLGAGEFISRVVGREEELPDALIVLVGAFHRLFHKYGPFGYRLINLDAGAALSQLHLVAQSMNLCARTAASRADDLIQDQLRLNAFNEQATAVVELSGKWRKEKRATSQVQQPASVPDAPRSWKMASEFANLDLEEVMAMVFAESRVLELEPRPAREIPPRLLARDRGRSLTVRLPKAVRGGLSVEEILAKRRSVREFNQDAVQVKDLATALHCAFSTDVTAWPGEYQYGFPLTYFVLANRIFGVEQGVYAYDAERHRFVRIRPALSHEERVELFVQSEFADAPVLIWITGNLAAACAAGGAGGHRHLLLRAGMAGHRLWMAALSLGLSGSILAGLIPGAARRLLGIDGYTTASLFAFAAGYPLENQQTCDLR